MLPFSCNSLLLCLQQKDNYVVLSNKKEPLKFLPQSNGFPSPTPIGIVNQRKIKYLIYYYDTMAIFCNSVTISSIFQMKITATVTKGSHQDHGLCYLHLPIFFVYITLSFSAGN